MPAKYPQTKPRFEVDDKVVLGPEHRWHHRAYTEVPPGTICTIQEVDPPYSHEVFSTHTYRLTYQTHGKTIESHVDEDCLEPLVVPVTEDELAEVFQILGVEGEPAKPVPEERLTILANSNLSRGKYAAAAVHAALLHYGIDHGAVIVLGANQSKIEKECDLVIHDAGRTEVDPGTVTAGVKEHLKP